MYSNWRDQRDLGKEWARRSFERLGYRVERLYPRDLSRPAADVIAQVRPYSMTSVDALAALCAAAEHVVTRGVVGSIVECGVWRGGSMMAVAKSLQRLGVTDRELYLFDTFEGMPPPTAHDVRVLDGLPAGDPSSLTPGIAVEEEAVRRAVESTGYPTERIHLVRGRVEDTLPDAAPDAIALLRLDTDWYESTRHELEHLFPRLAVGGILVIDDYGHWAGARAAVDEYMAAHAPSLFLHRVDYTVRLAVKT